MTENKKLSGFTLVELLVFLAIGSIVFIYLSSIFGDFYQARNRTIKTEEAHNALTVAFNRILQDSRWTDWEAELPDVSHERLKLNNLDPDTGNIETIVYELDDETLERNGIAVTSDQVEVKEFEVANLRNGADQVPFLVLNMVVVHKQKDPKVLFEEEMVLSLRKKGFSIDPT
jgi:type II secretory pathway pseudopilin PulG